MHREGLWSRRHIAPVTLYLEIRWMCMVNFMPRSRYFRRKSPGTDLCERGGPRSGLDFPKREKSLYLPGNQRTILGSSIPWHNVGVHKYRAPDCHGTTFFTVVLNIFESSLWNLIQVTIQVSTILRWILNFWKIYAPLA